MRGAACCALRSGPARVFALRAGARGAQRATATDDVREHARWARHGVQCAWNGAMRMESVHVSGKACMCAFPTRRAHRGRAGRGNARVARSAVRAGRRGASPFGLAMGSWERSRWGPLPPWETFKFFLSAVRTSVCVQRTRAAPPRYDTAFYLSYILRGLVSNF
jgi:hypothetical protein